MWPLKVNRSMNGATKRRSAVVWPHSDNGTRPLRTTRLFTLLLTS